MASPTMDMSYDEIRLERAAKRAQSLRRKRTEFVVRVQSRAERAQRRSQSATPVAARSPQGAARVAARSCMVKGLAETIAEMPDAAMLKTCDGHGLGSKESWQVFIEEDISLRSCRGWTEREMPDKFRSEPAMDDTTDEGSEYAGGTAGSSDWGTPPSALLLDQQDMEALELPMAGVDMPSSPQTDSHIPLEQDVPPAPSMSPRAPPLAVMPEADEEATELVQDDQAARPASTELEDEWVIVPPPGADSLRQGALDLVDGQHPRNLFAKKPHTQRTTSNQTAIERAWAIDWSREGIPQEVKSKIMQGSMDASHRGLYVKEEFQRALPLNVLRAENVHRQNSSSRSRQSSVPRSQSRSRAIKQAGGGR